MHLKPRERFLVKQRRHLLAQNRRFLFERQRRHRACQALPDWQACQARNPNPLIRLLTNT